MSLDIKDKVSALHQQWNKASKKWQSENPEKVKKYGKSYQKLHRKELNERKIENRKKNPEKYKQSYKKWANENKDYIKVRNAKYKEINKEDLKEYSQSYRLRPEHRFKEYVRSAKKRNIGFDLTFEQFIQYWQKPCYYCGDIIDNIGIDRVDNAKGYEVGNIISCCQICNYAKRTQTKDDFIKMCVKVAKKAGV
jgi:hypothetical protein